METIKKIKITETKTEVIKSFHGWRASTIRTQQNRTFEIYTTKGYRGEIISHSTECEVEQGGGFITKKSVHAMFSNVKPVIAINHGKIRATENTIKKAHFEALAKFDEVVNTEEFKKQSEKANDKPEIGTILFLDGYGKDIHSRENQDIVYKIENGTYYTVEKTTFVLNQHTHVNNIENKFGIGTYYKTGYNMQSLGLNQDDLNNFLIDADKRQKANEILKEAQYKAKQEEKEKKEKYLSQFIKADKRKTTSLIKQYIKEKFPTVQKVEVQSDSFSMGDSLDVYYYAPEEIEELNNFIDSLQYGYFNSMEDIYEHKKDRKEVIYNGYILEDYKYTSYHFKQVEEIKKDQEQINPEKINAAGLTIQKYSDKAGVIYGDTKTIKDDLKALGCRFNARLTVEGEKVAGWIFQLSKMEEIKNKFC
jgi:hypothetical protein